MTPIELMTVWSRTGKTPELNVSQLNNFYSSLEVLAKILATENITLNFSSNRLLHSQHNADFDLENRVLSIAPFDNELLHTLPGTVSHEIGHALFTEYTDDVKEFIDQNGVLPVWNIIEDGYIERQTCLKFAGIKKYLQMRFDEIFVKNPVDQNINFTTDVINILNVRCKSAKYGYKLPPYPDGLSVEELQQLYDAENCNDHDTMVRIEKSVKLMQMLNIANKRIKEKDDITEQNNEFENDDTTESDNKSESDSTDGNNADDSKSEDLNVPDIINNFSNEVQSENIFDEDKELNRIRRKNNTAKEVYKLITAEDMNTLFPTLDIMEMCGTDGVSKWGIPSFLTDSGIFPGVMKRFKNNNLDAQENAQQLFRKFAAKANAENLKRVNYRTTGILDPVRLTTYKIFDDIFQQTRIVPKQINHGFVVMLDWSGSMQAHTSALIHRIMELAHFAMLAKVDLEVWLYTDSNLSITARQLKSGDPIKRENVIFRPPKIIHVLSTKINSKQDITNRLINLYFASFLIGKNWDTLQQKTLSKKDKSLLSTYKALMVQHGTTIVEAVIFASDRLNRMNSQKRSLILMTDGSDNDFDCILDTNTKLLKNVARDEILSDIASSDILINGISVFSLISKELENYKQLIDNNLTQEEIDICIAILLAKPRMTTLRALIESMKHRGTDITVLGWELPASKCSKFTPFSFSLGGDVINIKQDISINASRIRHSGRYTHIDNNFIDELCKRLIGDIYRT